MYLHPKDKSGMIPIVELQLQKLFNYLWNASTVARQNTWLKSAVSSSI